MIDGGRGGEDPGTATLGLQGLNRCSFLQEPFKAGIVDGPKTPRGAETHPTRTLGCSSGCFRDSL